jgi:hypothetical protein
MQHQLAAALEESLKPQYLPQQVREAAWRSFAARWLPQAATAAAAATAMQLPCATGGGAECRTAWLSTCAAFHSACRCELCCLQTHRRS